MQNFSSFSSSSNLSNIDILQSHLQSVKNISHSQNSVISEYQKKIQENLALKESFLSFKAQEQFLLEQLQMKEAEFAFQKEQYETEIQCLRQNESELHATIDKLSESKQEDINELRRKLKASISLTDSCSDNYTQSIIQENKRLRFQNEQLQTEVDVLKNSMRIYNHEKDDLKSDISIKAERIEKLNNEIQILLNENQKIKQEFQNFRESSGNIETSISVLKAQNTKLQSDLSSKNQELILLNHATDEVRSISYCSAIQRKRINIFKIFAEQQKNIGKMIYDLFPQNFSHLSELRPIVLSVIFALKWKHNTGKPNEICSINGGLTPFQSNKIQTAETLLRFAQSELQNLRTSLKEKNDEINELKSVIKSHEENNLNFQHNRKSIEMQLKFAKKLNNTLHSEITSLMNINDLNVNSQLEN